MRLRYTPVTYMPMISNYVYQGSQSSFQYPYPSTEESANILVPQPYPAPENTEQAQISPIPYP